MYILNITSVLRKTTANKLRYIIFENYYNRMGVARQNGYYLIKYQKKII